MEVKVVTKNERKRRAIRKAVRTRAANRAAWKRYYEVDAPANRRIENLVNYLLKTRNGPISVRWNPVQETGKRLKHGVVYGELLAVQHGGKNWIVKPEGYKRAQRWHAGFWEPLLP